MTVGPPGALAVSADGLRSLPAAAVAVRRGVKSAPVDAVFTTAEGLRRLRNRETRGKVVWVRARPFSAKPVAQAGDRRYSLSRV